MQKDPRLRLASAHDARLLLEGAFESAATFAVVTAAPIAACMSSLLPYAVGALIATVPLGYHARVQLAHPPKAQPAG